jgi:phage-related protein
MNNLRVDAMYVVSTLILVDEIDEATRFDNFMNAEQLVAFGVVMKSETYFDCDVSGKRQKAIDNMAYIPYNESKGEDMAEFEVVFYEKENGECPVENFLVSLDAKMRAKMVGLLELLEEKGNRLREPYSKQIDDGIFEIRCKVGSNITRVLYFFYFEGKIVLTNGFVKKTQKTPREEIRLAKERRSDYKERMGKS